MKKIRIKLNAAEWQDLNAALRWYISKAQTEHKNTEHVLIFYTVIGFLRRNSDKFLFYIDRNLLLAPNEAIALYMALTAVDVISIHKIRSEINKNFLELK